MSRKEQLQSIANKFYAEWGDAPISLTRMAEWAINKGYWQASSNALVRQCAEELGEAMREEHITDPQDRSVRAKHAAKVRGPDGKQMTLWGDIRSSDRRFMEIALKWRRDQIVGDCRQLKTDVVSYNVNWNKGPEIQMIFDFNNDLQESDALAASASGDPVPTNVSPNEPEQQPEQSPVAPLVLA